MQLDGVADVRGPKSPSPSVTRERKGPAAGNVLIEPVRCRKRVCRPGSPSKPANTFSGAHLCGSGCRYGKYGLVLIFVAIGMPILCV